jgi:hypothetical protein
VNSLSHLLAILRVSHLSGLAVELLALFSFGGYLLSSFGLHLFCLTAEPCFGPVQGTCKCEGACAPHNHTWLIVVVLHLFCLTAEPCFGPVQGACK